MSQLKYHNKITEVDNVKFHSKAESQRYLELKLLLRAKKIDHLVLQPKFDLYAGIKYIADFMYYEVEKPELFIVEDVKGMKTPVYNLKKKLFLDKYPALKFIEI